MESCRTSLPDLISSCPFLLPFVEHAVKKPLQLAILGNPDGWYVKDLRRAAEARGQTTVEVLSFASLQAGSTPAGAAWIRGHRAEGEPKPVALVDENGASRYHGLLVRTMPLGSLEQVIFRMNALHLAQHAGVVVMNPPRTLEIAIDKWLTLDMARRTGLPTPRTTVCQGREEALAAFEALDRNVVVKPLFGGEGRGLMHLDDLDLAWRVFSTLEQLGSAIYLQEYIPHRGFDLRVLIIGAKSYTVARHATGGDWRTNVSRGGQAKPQAISASQYEMAWQAAQAVGGWMVGVDILPAADGRDLLLEVNAVPGWRGTAQALHTDIGQTVLEEFSQLLE
jgi:tetrahydromethanopterin:alpha-L-glutamate ligase